MAVIISIIVIAFLLFFAIRGWVKGFLKVALTTFSLVLTIILATVLMTPLTNFLVENTEIRNSIEGKIEKGLGWSEGTSYGNGKNITASAENEIIDELSIPEILKNSLKEGNTPEEYVKIGVTNFKDYVVRSTAILIIKIIVFITLIIAIYILIRLLLVVSKIITSIPVIHGINRFFGFLLGILEGLLFVWLICFIITLIAGTTFGLKIVDMIHESSFLTYLYDNNWLLAGINKLISMF